MNRTDIAALIQDVATPHSEIPDDVNLTPAEVLHHIDLDSIDSPTLWELTEAAFNNHDPEE